MYAQYKMIHCAYGIKRNVEIRVLGLKDVHGIKIVHKMFHRNVLVDGISRGTTRGTPINCRL